MSRCTITNKVSDEARFSGHDVGKENMHYEMQSKRAWEFDFGL
jgi:hypothetical protein